MNAQMNTVITKTLEQEEQLFKTDFSFIEINDEFTYKSACENLKRVKDRARVLIEQRKSLTKPIDESKKRIMDMFKPVIEKYNSIEKAVKTAIISYDDSQEQKRLKLESEIKGDIPCQTIKHDGISIRSNWKYKIIDESKIPREYLVIDHDKLKKACMIAKSSIRKNNTSLVKGVEFYKDSTVAVKS